LTKSTRPHALIAERIQRARVIRQVVVPAGDAESITATPTPAPVSPSGLLHDARAGGQRRAVVERRDRPIVVNTED